MRGLVLCKKEQELEHCMMELEHCKKELEHCRRGLELHTMPEELKYMYYIIKEEIDSRVQITSVP